MTPRIPIPDIRSLETALRESFQRGCLSCDSGYHSKLDLATLFRIRQARARCGFDARHLDRTSSAPSCVYPEGPSSFTGIPVRGPTPTLSSDKEPLSLLIGRCLTSMTQEAMAEAFGAVFRPKDDNESMRMLCDAHEIDISELTDSESRCGWYEWAIGAVSSINPLSSILTKPGSINGGLVDQTNSMVENFIDELNRRADCKLTDGMGVLDAEGLVKDVQATRDDGLPRTMLQSIEDSCT